MTHEYAFPGCQYVQRNGWAFEHPTPDRVAYTHPEPDLYLLQPGSVGVKWNSTWGWPSDQRSTTGVLWTEVVPDHADGLPQVSGCGLLEELVGWK